LTRDFWWLGHDDASGQALLRPAVIGAGLAAAMLGDAIFTRRRCLPTGVWFWPAGRRRRRRRFPLR
jgi:hypothetical protein